ncbi:hypothetical protein, partial [Rhizobium leguminosarum]|uniref:hypothetical protein n=1 Tax=Rhizobium leguminosarum TaxID=384 RepID=UPI003F998EFD
GVAVWLLAGRDLGARVLAAVTAVAVAVAIAVVSVGGSLAHFAAAFSTGPQRLLSTEWPSPVRGDLVGTVAAGLAGMSAGAALLATGRR